MRILFIIELLVFVFFSHVNVANAQEIYSLHTEYDDSFKSWLITTDDEFEGTLELQWPLRNDWTEWEFDIADQSGTIRQKWKNDPTNWELRCNGKTIEMRTVWSGEFTEWNIRTDTGKRLRFRAKWPSTPDEWQLKSSESDEFVVYAEYERDPRDWIVINDFGENLSFETRLAMIFIAIYHSSPKV